MFLNLTLEEIRQQYGENSSRRQFLFARPQTAARLLLETGQLSHLYVIGSFTSTKPTPGDLDCFVVMATGFSTERLAPPYLEIFQHDVCRLRYQMDVFWVTEAVVREHREAMLDVFSRNREGASQSIIEVTL